MLHNKKTESMFKKDLLSIKIPEKEKVLPVQALMPKIKEIRKYNVLAITSRVALVGVAMILVFTCMNSPLKNAFVPTIDMNSTDNISTDVSSSVSDITEEKKKVVITADYLDNHNIIDESVPSSKKIYISEMLKEKLEQYKGQDVLFRVTVDLPKTKEEGDNFLNKILFESNEFTTESEIIKRLKKELANYKEYSDKGEKYYNYIISVKEMEIEISQEFYDILKKYEEIKPYLEQIDEIYEEINNIKRECSKKYYKILINEKIEFIKSLGITEMTPINETSENTSYFGSHDAYIIELTEEMITKMTKRGGFAFKLAAPERATGYDRKISDSLTLLLEQAKENDEFHVAVVSILDKDSSFAYLRNILCNSKYNSDLNTDWQKELTNDNVSKYIDDILIRNNISDKRIFNEKLADFQIANLGFNNSFISNAGFEVKLSKEQIIALIADPDIKVIYSMDNSGYDRLSDIIEE